MIGSRSGAQSKREFEEFAHARGTALFRTALLLCGDWHLAEDLTQSALARIYSSWGRVRRADSPEAYARRVLVRTYLSHRRLRRTAERSAIGELPERETFTEGPSLRITLLSALALLPPRDRAVLVLRYWEDRGVEETAAELGLNVGAVRTRSLRALNRLRAHLGEQLTGLGSS
ncbi:SigE family RNA polymerase sigma factor [Kitasatospora sp. NPDC048540]|uniref:SigE family RNA polymerase sigma factor n=1 Tax=Kitasatospora sp. NPDC048540 TaxID=3155634 RepID=UPI00340CE41F